MTMIDLFNLSRRNPFDRIHENQLAAYFDQTLGAFGRQALQFAVLLAIYVLILTLLWSSGTGDQQIKLRMLGIALGIIGGVVLFHFLFPALVQSGLEVLRLLDHPDQLRDDAVPPGGWPVLPPLPHAAAMRIGEQLAGKWDSLIGPEVPKGDDLVWADLVQYVLLKAREAQQEFGAEGAMP